nr:MAG TPA: hypothetical protein [Caudoviricetes sp.]
MRSVCCAHIIALLRSRCQPCFWHFSNIHKNGCVPLCKLNCCVLAGISV